MALTAIDRLTALILIDLQKGITAIPTAQPMAQPTALVAQAQPETAVTPVQQVPVQQVPAPVHAVPTAQPVMEKLPA